MVNLTPHERKIHARLGNRTENWIKKILAYMKQRPELTPMYINAAEFENDIETRNNIGPILKQLAFLNESLSDTYVLLGSDIYKLGLAYYRNMKLVSKSDVPGTTQIYEDLASQFPNVTSTKKKKSEETNSDQ